MGSQGGGAGAYFSWLGAPLDEPPAHLRDLFEHSVTHSSVPQQCSPATSTPSIYVCRLEPNLSDSQLSTLQTAASATHINEPNPTT